MPHILDRISAHKRAIASVLHAGMAKNHRAKPSSSLQLEKIYGSSVLFSGVGSLVLNGTELKTLSNHFKLTVSRLQKLPLNTPECVVFFLSGNLPATAIVHLRMLSLLGMISRLGPSSILQQTGRNTLLSSRPNKKSWFTKIRDICNQYLLPDPLLVFQDPKSKDAWKSQCKAQVVSYWEKYLRHQAEMLPSLMYFKPQYMSLTRPHCIWLLPESGYEVEKSVVVASMLSGRYATDYHTRHWSRSNQSGYCQLCLAELNANSSPASYCSLPLGTLEHQLLDCPALTSTRENSKALWRSYCKDKPEIWNLIVAHSSEEIYPQMQFLLDPSCCPIIIRATQSLGSGVLHHIYYLTRSWCYSLHLRRRKNLKLLNII